MLLVTLSGCATIAHGGPDEIPVSTNPAGATVFVDDVRIGQTPLLIPLHRHRSRGAIRIELPGFVPVVMVRGKSMNGWFWANLCVPGIGFVGMAIDYAFGNMRGFDDGPIAIGLTPAYGAPPGAAMPGQPAPPPLGHTPAAVPR